MDFLSEITTVITESIQKNGPIAVFIGGILEQVIAPIPSPLIATVGGFLLIPKDATIVSALWLGSFRVAIPYTLAATVGVSFVYLIAYFGGKPLTEKFKGYLGFSWEDVEAISRRFRGDLLDAVMIFLLRAVPVIPISVISGVCGLIRTKAFLFYVSSLLGILVRSIILAIIGWKMQEGYKAIIGGFDRAENIITVVSIVIIFFLLYIGYKNRGKFLKAN
jgi:membrane protein DedA with SNARE-associated domain